MFINSATLTDEEFNSIDEDLNYDYNRDTYLAMKTILEDRESVSAQLSKLAYYFKARGVEISTAETYTPVSKIFIGSEL